MSNTRQPHGDTVHRIYHTTDATAWKPESGKPYAPESMTDEGFIHACTWSQLPGVATRFFASREGVIVLEIDVKLLPSEPMRVRYSDPRLGYFSITQVSYGL